MPTELIEPYGGRLVDLTASPEELDELRAYAAGLPSVHLSERSMCDLELLATGAFSPLDRFMEEESYRRVLEEMRLAGGCLFPVPVTLPVDPERAALPTSILDKAVALRGPDNDLLAVLTVEEIYSWDLAEEAQRVLGTRDRGHPTVAEMERWGRLNVSGRLRVSQLPLHYDFAALRMTPAQTRARLTALGKAT